METLEADQEDFPLRTPRRRPAAAVSPSPGHLVRRFCILLYEVNITLVFQNEYKIGKWEEHCQRILPLGALPCSQ